ncbi:MAG: HAMP domain-containing histidine kinase [Lachnospiraceae bacterium]|nr:HAMP domain-containing histidine kinase [Lachnospiraceae bacterium]
MNKNAVKKMRHKFISITMLSIFLVMLFVGVGINLTNLIVTKISIERTINYIIKNEGKLPEGKMRLTKKETRTADATEEYISSTGENSAGSTEFVEESIVVQEIDDEKLIDDSIFDDYSPEFHYATRYFAVIYDDDGVTDVILSHISSVDEDEAESIANTIIDRGKKFGRYNMYYYKKGTLDNGSKIAVFVDSTSHIKSNYRVVFMSMVICGFSLLIVFILVCVFSGKVIKPELKNIERQKMFITNASHELKTPLSVIKANTEMTEMLEGSSEWTESTLRQVDRMLGLIGNLVTVARADELADRSVLERINVSDIIKESLDNFRSRVMTEEKTLDSSIEEDVFMIADKDKIEQLTGLLVDNAIKYCDDKGKINVKLEAIKGNKQLRLVVTNDYKEGGCIDCKRFFDRFYREDTSHNIDKGGYGIGLSMAESICHEYGGSIKAGWKDGVIAFICVLSCK